MEKNMDYCLGGVRYDSDEYSRIDGGPGSGNWGHAGRVGIRGGSAPGISKKLPHEIRTLSKQQAENFCKVAVMDSYEISNKRFGYPEGSRYAGPEDAYLGMMNKETMSTVAWTVENVTEMFETEITSIDVYYKDEGTYAANKLQSMMYDGRRELIFNEFWFADPESLQVSMEKDMKPSKDADGNWRDRFHPEVPSERVVEAVVMHELGHTVFLDIGDNFYSEATPEFRQKHEKAKTELVKIRDEYTRRYGEAHNKMQDLTKASQKAALDGDKVTADRLSKQAAAQRRQLERISIGRYAATDLAEFVAEAFVVEMCGGQPNTYTRRVMKVLEDYAGKKET